ncbi:unnamed protein product, partial [Didymodactylos carnosus]
MEVLDDSIDLFKKYKLKCRPVQTEDRVKNEQSVELQNNYNREDEIVERINHRSNVYDNSDDFYLQFQITNVNDILDDTTKVEQSSNSCKEMHRVQLFDHKDILLLLDDNNSLHSFLRERHRSDEKKGLSKIGYK